jgi:hypothetical protein
LWIFVPIPLYELAIVIKCERATRPNHVVNFGSRRHAAGLGMDRASDYVKDMDATSDCSAEAAHEAQPIAAT